MRNNFWFQLNKPILALAPMAGITDGAFRQMCVRYGADVTYSEMASVSALFYKPKKTLELVKFNKEEQPYIVQLFGKHPEHFAASAKIITEKIKPDGIDINFGCPAKKVFGHGSGCALMPQKKLAREIISAVCDNTDLPVSIKIRAGIEKSGYLDTHLDIHPGKSSKQAPEVCSGRPRRSAGISALEFIENTADLPYSAVMIHARTYEGGFSGPVDFSIAEKIKKIIPNKIVLANGGILDSETAVKTLNSYPLLDGLGIARGAWGRPWIFKEIKSSLCSSSVIRTGDGTDAKDFNADKIKRVMLEHAKLIYENKGKRGLFEIRKHMSWYVKGFPGASEIRRKLVLAKSLEEIKEILKSNQLG